MSTKTANVIGSDGSRGTIDDPKQLDDSRTMSVPIHLVDGGDVWVPAHVLSRKRDGSFTIDASLSQIAGYARSLQQDGADAPPGERPIDSAVVRIHKSIENYEQLVDEPLFREEVKIDRVPIGRVIDGPQPIRQEGESTIVPLLEEVLVIEKRLMLKEELHITRVRWERHEQQRIPLRREEVRVDRHDLDGAKEQANG